MDYHKLFMHLQISLKVKIQYDVSWEKLRAWQHPAACSPIGSNTMNCHSKELYLFGVTCHNGQKQLSHWTFKSVRVSTQGCTIGCGACRLAGITPPPNKKKQEVDSQKKIQERFRSASLFSQPCIQYLVIKKRYWPFVAHNFGTSGDSSERWVATCRASFRIHPKRVDLFFKSLMLLQAQIYKGKTCGLMRIVVKEN